MLHVLNGDSTRVSIERSGIPGTFLVWPDVLYEGPTPLATGEEWIAARAGHLGRLVTKADKEIAEGYRRTDAALESFRDHDELVFWLEHDLFDQLLLIRHLWWLGIRDARQTPTKLSLVCHHWYLGTLQPDAFPPLFAARQPITDEQMEIGARAWTAFCGEDPTRLTPLAAEPSPALPFLAPALRRFLEEYPSVENGLSRTERQILTAVSDGPRTMNQAFRASTELESAIFMGDLSFFGVVESLASAKRPLVTLDERTIDMTDTGRAVLAGRADHIALNGVDRWAGGVHLRPGNLWRWSGRELLRA